MVAAVRVLPAVFGTRVKTSTRRLELDGFGAEGRT
jgi:hypothetical protein